MKIGFIGLGKMGTAVAHCVAEVTEAHEIYFSNHRPEVISELCAQTGVQLVSNQDIVSRCDVIFLGIKPDQLSPVLSDLSESISKNPQALWVSMLAGVTLAQLTTYLPKEAGIIRMMPNVPMRIGQGITTYALPDLARAQADKAVFESLLSSSGVLQMLPEPLIDAATGIAGCGPAFVYQFIEALTDAGVQNGLKRADALELSAQTVKGAAQLVLESRLHPAVLRDDVTSPGGSTIAGVVTLEKHGFRHATIEAVNQAIKRTRELGQ